MPGDMIEIGSSALSASINPFGAELSSLRDSQGRELMTDADPAYWTGRAPILFPIVGRLNDDVLWLDGTSYRMEKHGFARRSMFDAVDVTASSARFRMTDSVETRTQYPFAFLLEIGFAIEGATLTMTAKIGNDGDVPMPFSFGWHPAFAWPQPGGARDDHYIAFEQDEPGPLRGLNTDGLIAEDRASPVMGNRLPLADALFERDALIWNPINSQRLTYGSDSGPRLHIAFPDTPRLGIWTKPGARYVCIEPWHGIADPVGYQGEFRDKPGIMSIAPGAQHSAIMRVTVAE
ncbi:MULTISPECIES: aldose 1-epimerase family protein [unclassified Sphingomonas]|uniref:aldose 1-epimerase family protein n=1 Tax=unclassified Sphingomonas TaxID=196159 RepID=UPI000BCC13FF|nr:MAG: aldose epimerase [Sphingomonas sp. 32-62-10]